MSSPSTIRDDTLSVLRGTRRDMSRNKYIRALKKQPAEVRKKAAFAVLDVEEAILELSNAQLSDIRDKLIANEDALKDSREALKKARRSLEKVKDVLDKTADLIGLLGKFLSLTLT